MTIKLYTLCGADPKSTFSPHAWKAVMALHHKGLTFEEIPVPFTEIPKIEGGASKTVPVLTDGTRVVADSFLIADYLEETYPDRPSLFGGPGGQAAARFVESWTNVTLHGAMRGIILLDVHERLAPVDQAYFRQSREQRMGKTLEEVTANRAAAIEALSGELAPLRQTLKAQPFLGGEKPLFSDYIVFGALQWARIVTADPVIGDDDPVADWFGRCLDLHGGAGRKVAAAAA